MGKSKKSVLNLNEYILDVDKYQETIEEILTELDESLKNRYNPFTFKLDDGREITYTISNMLTMLVLLTPFMRIEHSVPCEIIPDQFEISSSIITKFYDDIIRILEDEVPPEELNLYLASTSKMFSHISGKYAGRISDSFSIHDIIEICDSDKEFDELVNHKFEDNIQFDEIEAFIKEKTKVMADKIKSVPTSMRNYFRSETGVNLKQVSQLLINIGPKPNLHGDVMSHCPNTNFLQGMENIKDYYVVCTGARKALIITHKKTQDSGYLTRKMQLLTADTMLSETTFDCGTAHYLAVNVDNAATLKRLNGRYCLNEDMTDFVLIDGFNDTHLIGTKIYMRSSMKCAAKDGICHVCYGKLASLNASVHIGLLAATFLNDQIMQRMLSAKHLLQTNSVKIEWSDEFMTYFAIDKSHINVSQDLKDYSKFAIKINFEDLNENENEEVDDNEIVYHLNKFTLIKKERGNKESEVLIESPVDLTVTKDFYDLINEYTKNDEFVRVPFNAIMKDRIPLFSVVTVNNEIFKPLMNILALIETSDHLGLTEIDDVYNMFISLLNESDIGIDSTHIELILRNLIRDPENLSESPNWADSEYEPEYTILKLSNAIMTNKSLAIRLSFEHIKKQLEDPNTYEDHASSILDSLFFN